MKINLSRRRFIGLVGTGSAALATAGFVRFSGSENELKPNFIILFADDLGYGDLSCYGHPYIRTPNLDKMANEGVRLTSFYAANPVCSPSRAALLTGRYPLRCGVPHVYGPDTKEGLPEDEITIADQLKKLGYHTACIGKWHLGHSKKEYMPTSRGFDYYYGLLYSNDMIKPWVQTDSPLQLYENLHPIEHPVNQDTLTQRYTEKAIEFIQSNKDNPFFFYLPYTMPHLPLHATDTFREKSRAGLYGAVIEEIDWSIGEILNTLKKYKLDSRTMVVFTSDNGPWNNMPPRMLQEGIERWDAGTPGLLRGSKGTTYEGGMRVPGIVRWTDVFPAGQLNANLATTMDLFPTIMSAAGGELPKNRKIDGNNILSMLKGQEASPNEELYYLRGEYIEAVRVGPWKYRFAKNTGSTNSGTEKPEEELYNLELDWSERYNVADLNPDVVKKLNAKLVSFAQQVGGKIEQ